MKKGWNIRCRSRAKRGPESKHFLVAFVAVTLTALVIVLLGVVSTRPSFSTQAFTRNPAAGGAVPVDWPTLERLSAGPEEAIPETLLRSPLRVPGYMLSFEERPDARGEVSRFLLVPDPGSWIHPPHLDAGEVVIVNMEKGTTARLVERQAVWVKGTLAPSLTRQGQIEAAFQITASDVEPYEAVKPGS
jgi:hypothetical protein